MLTDRSVQNALSAEYAPPLGEYKFAKDMLVATGQDIYAAGTDFGNGLLCNDPNQFGRGLSRVSLTLANFLVVKATAKGFGYLFTRPSTVAILQRLASQAGRVPIPPGTSTTIAGTLKHSEFANLIKTLGHADLGVEERWFNGARLPKGVGATPKGSVRLDVVEYGGNPRQPVAIYDLKTGKAGLTPQRIQQILSHMPNNGIMPNGQPIPVMEIRP